MYLTHKNFHCFLVIIRNGPPATAETVKDQQTGLKSENSFAFQLRDIGINTQME